MRRSVAGTLEQLRATLISITETSEVRLKELDDKVEQNAATDVPFPERRSINQIALQFQLDQGSGERGDPAVEVRGDIDQRGAAVAGVGRSVHECERVDAQLGKPPDGGATRRVE